MSDWPSNLTVAPIRDWPGELTPAAQRTRSAFRTRDASGWGTKPVPVSKTLSALDTELRALGASNVELLIAIPAGKFRNDGRPYADAKAEHPGIILSFDTEGVGHLSYPCDTFTTWQDNLRAVTLALEALRKVDRYGVTKRGEQYRGFLALEGGIAVPSTPFGHDPASVLDWLGEQVYGPAGPPTSVDARTLIRKAQATTHPDRGGDAEKFRLVTLAEQYLREAGTI